MQPWSLSIYPDINTADHTPFLQTKGSYHLYFLSFIDLSVKYTQYHILHLIKFVYGKISGLKVISFSCSSLCKFFMPCFPCPPPLSRPDVAGVFLLIMCLVFKG